jgi:hypothetical protein
MIDQTPNPDPEPLRGWGPSIRAICLTNSYAEYLALMAQYTNELRHELDPDYD